MSQSPEPQTINELFQAQVQRTPDAIALIDGQRSYSYRELDDLTNRIAAQLQIQGVQSEIIVGCLLHDSYTLVVAILSILKAGGVYLLLDRKLPPDRARYILADAKPHCIITNIQSPVSVLKNQQVLQIDALAAADERTYVAPKMTTDNLAYIAYTSGSTGTPKGVMITHGATVNHALAYKEIFKLDANDRAPLMAPAAFDMATEEIIPPLLAGCTLVDAPAVQPSMDSFTQSIIDNGYTFLNLPAPLWHEWTTYLRLSGTAIPPKLRFVIAGSDKLYTSRYHEWQAIPGADAVRWIAAYGVTEATVTSTLYLTAAEDKLDPNDEPYMPIGTPIHGVAAYILDTAGKETAIGEIGELYIGGAGLARGYLNLPAITTERFVADPFSNVPGARLYKTGDLAQRLPNGAIVWVGREDDQIKINGLRIEPAEIEATLESHTKIDDAVVVFVPSQDPDEPGTLVGFVTSKQQRPLNLPYIYSLLRDRLPAAMVPAKLIPLAAIPLNANGKLDRRTLQAKAQNL